MLKRAAVGVYEDLEEAERSLIAEAHIGAALQHPHVIHIYDLVDLPEGLMLAMEYLPGVSLFQLMEHPETEDVGIPPFVATQIIADAARGLDHIHHARTATGEPLNVVHQDVSPENLIVTTSGRTKVVDLGAAATSRSQPRHDVIGKLGYHSPEQLRGASVDRSTDVFSLGVVLHELLTGRRLFLSDSPESTNDAVLSRAIPEVPDNVGAMVQNLVGTMLARQRQRRPAMKHVAEVLNEVTLANGIDHRSVAAFLTAEMGERIESRRRAVEELLSSPSSMTPRSKARRKEGLTRTLTIVEAAFDLVGSSPTSLETPSALRSSQDTDVDQGPPWWTKK